MTALSFLDIAGRRISKPSPMRRRRCWSLSDEAAGLDEVAYESDGALASCDELFEASKFRCSFI